MALLTGILWLLLASVEAAAEAGSSQLKLTEREMKQYDGTDPEKPIYLAINGTIFDVSVSPAFYGPGGHYHHFTGKDASRAWITECWDAEDQLTWRLEGIEAMFMPKYLDEQMEQAAAGKLTESDMEGAAAYGLEELGKMAQTVLGKLGRVSEKELEERRVADAKEAGTGVQRQLQHWIDFFQKNEKYSVVGTMILDENKPEPPEICSAAMRKRPMKGGKLDTLMKMAGTKGGLFDGEKKPAATEMPDFVKDAMKKRKIMEKTAANEEQEGEDLVRDEL